MKKQYLFSLFALLILVSSCKLTVEGETNSWDTNMQRLSSMSAKYPNFKAVIETTMEKAETAWDEALSVSDEKAKIQAMSKANDLASPEYIRNLENFDRKVNNIRDLAAKASQMANDHSDSDAAWHASQSADRTIQESRNQLSKAAPSAVPDANAVVASIIRNLESAENRLNKVVKTAKDKKKEEKKAADEKKTAEDEKKAAEEKKAAPIKCGSCGNSSPAGTAKCGSCGAPLS